MPIRYTTIGLDLDDTIADHTENFRELAREYGIEREFTPAEIAVRALKHHLPKEAYREIANRAYGERSAHVPPMPESVDVIRALVEEGVNVHIISHRGEDGVPHARAWIAKNLPFLPQENAHFTDETTSKRWLCEETGAQLFLDNKPSVLDDLPETMERLVFDPFDAFADESSAGSYSLSRYDKKLTHPRITSWREFEKCVCGKNNV